MRNGNRSTWAPHLRTREATSGGSGRSCGKYSSGGVFSLGSEMEAQLDIDRVSVPHVA
jgi:hypothetical protein